MKIVFLSIKDYASSAQRYVRAINKFTEHEAKLIKIQSFEYALKNPEADMILANKQANIEIANKWISEADIIHFKGDDLPRYDWFSLNIPRHKPIICTVGGSQFRRGANVAFSLGNNKLQDYIDITVARTVITPDLNYAGYQGIYIPHTYDFQDFQNEWKYREIPIIAHSYWENKKGTDVFLKACKILKEKGFKFEIDLIEKVPNEEALIRKKRATFFFDQCTTGWYGMSAIEAMAYGIPTMAYISDQALYQSEERFEEGLPVIKIPQTAEGIADKIAELFKLSERELRDISIKTRSLATAVHDYSAISKELIDLYDSVINPDKEFLSVKNNATSTVKNKVLFVCKRGSDNFAYNYFNSMTCVEKLITVPHNEEFVRNKINNWDGWVWIEWGGDFTKRVLEGFKTNTKIILRIHDWEISSEHVKKLDYSSVSLLWFINRDARRDFYNQLPVLTEKPNLYLPNAIDVSFFKNVKIRYGKKILAFGVAFKPRKQYKRLIQMFALLHSKDSEWSLTIKSPIVDGEQNKEYKECKDLAQLLNVSVKFDTSQVDVFSIKEKKGIGEYMSKFDVIVSTSDHEGFHYAIAEGILSGLKPVVYNWEWGRASDFWRPFLCDSIESMVEDLLLWSSKSDSEKLVYASGCIQYVTKNFSSKILAKKLENILFNNKTVVVAAHNHPYKNNPRGAEKSFFMICNQLKGLGYDIKVVIRNFKSSKEGNENLNGIDFFSVHESVYSADIKYKKKFEEIIKVVKPNVGITYGLPSNVAAEVFVEFNIPYILAIRWWRLVQPLPPGDLMNRKIDQIFIKTFMHIFRNAASVITNNKFATRVIDRYYNRESLYSFVPLTPSQEPINVGNKTGYILIITPNKDLGEYELLSKLVKLLPFETFLLVNTSQNDIYRFNSLGKNVVSKPYIQDMVEVYKKAKILLYPVYVNDVCGTSRVTIEAMSYGAPALCNERSGMEEGTPFTVSRDASPIEWANKIREINENYENCSKLARNTYLKYDMFTHLDVFIGEVYRIAFGS